MLVAEQRGVDDFGSADTSEQKRARPLPPSNVLWEHPSLVTKGKNRIRRFTLTQNHDCK